MKKILIFFCLFPILLSAQNQKRGYFDYLVEAKYKDWKSTGVFIKPECKSAQNLPVLNEEYIGSYPIVFVKISENSEELLLCYTDGPSGDPAFEFYRYKSNQDSELLFELAGTEIYVPGNGAIYTAGHTNNMFFQRKKFIFYNNSVTEVPQAYYYVGLKTKTLKSIQLYSDYECKIKLAVVSADSEVEVLVSEFTDETPMRTLKFSHQ